MAHVEHAVTFHCSHWSQRYNCTKCHRISQKGKLFHIQIIKCIYTFSCCCIKLHCILHNDNKAFCSTLKLGGFETIWRQNLNPPIFNLRCECFNVIILIIWQVWTCYYQGLTYLKRLIDLSNILIFQHLKRLYNCAKIK